MSPVVGKQLSCVTNSRFLSVDILEKLNTARAGSSVIRRSDLCDVAKSVHAFYAVSAVPEAFDFLDVQLGYLDKLTGTISRGGVAMA